VFGLSFRETIIFSRDYFKNVPSLRDFHDIWKGIKEVIRISNAVGRKDVEREKNAKKGMR